jgi:hypothetical protein
MLTFFYFLTVIALVFLFAESPIKKRLAKFKDGKFLDIWHFSFRAIWGAIAWFMLTALSSGGLHEVFPTEEAYLFSGSWITVLPALFWGVLISWIVIGRSPESEGDGTLSTYDDRLEAALSGAGKVVKFGFYALIAVLSFIVLLLLGTWIKSQASEMPPSTAIIIGAIIIAWAIAANRKS